MKSGKYIVAALSVGIIAAGVELTYAHENTCPPCPICPNTLPPAPPPPPPPPPSGKTHAITPHKPSQPKKAPTGSPTIDITQSDFFKRKAENAKRQETESTQNPAPSTMPSTVTQQPIQQLPNQPYQPALKRSASTPNLRNQPAPTGIPQDFRSNLKPRSQMAPQQQAPSDQPVMQPTDQPEGQPGAKFGVILKSTR